MKLGVVLPQTESGSDPVAIRDYVQAIEGLGFDYLLAYEHVIGANPDRPGGWQGPYTHESLFHEPFVLFGYLAALTQKIEFVTGILVLSQRQTVLVAKQAAALDVLSGGRLRLGVGIGWNHVEFEALNEDFHNRGKRSEEQVTLMRYLWTKPLVTFDGIYHTISDAGLNPLPVQQPIPVWFGGGADVVLKRMARMGDGWIMNTMPLDRGQQMIEQLRGYLAAEGRAPADFGIDVRINASRTPEAEWPREIAGWRVLGTTHLCINTMGLGFARLEQHLEVVRRFKLVAEG